LITLASATTFCVLLPESETPVHPSLPAWTALAGIAAHAVITAAAASTEKDLFTFFHTIRIHKKYI
jgi:hypothetical protein